MIVGVSLVNTVVKKLFSAWALSTMVFSTLLQKCIQCVCERERERERECVCECMCMSACVCV